MKKWFIFANICLILAICVGNIFLIKGGPVLLKGSMSAGFVLMGALGLVYVLKNNLPNKKFAIVMVCGLFLAMLGDIFLEFNFIVGALFFAIGHVFFFVAYCNLIKFRWKDLLYSACVFVPAVLLINLAPVFDFGGITYRLLCSVYALIISLMVGKSISNFVQNKNLLTVMLMIGSALFCFSDIILLFNVFSSVSSSFSFLCLATYYPAECVLGYSVLQSDSHK